jgi:sugar phosphate isomerase/epimerase
MRLIISALHFQWQDMVDCLRRAQLEYALDGVELSWHDSFSRPHCTPADFDTLETLTAPKAVLFAHIWENLAGLERDRAVAMLLHWLEICRRTGATGVVCHGGSHPDRRQGIVRVRRILEAVLPRFEQARVTLHIENHYAYDYQGCQELFSEPWEFLEVFALNSPSLAFCFDAGHAHMTRNAGPLVRELAPWLRHIHLADNHGVYDDHCPFGQGTVDWSHTLGLLREVRFDGTCCIEFPVGEDRRPLDRCVRSLKHVGFSATDRQS